jgi:hypothetical protein
MSLINVLLLGLLEPQYEGTAHFESSIAIIQTTRRNISKDFVFSVAVFLCLVMSTTQQGFGGET